jgi:iron(III) transport system permease protein
MAYPVPSHVGVASRKKWVSGLTLTIWAFLTLGPVVWLVGGFSETPAEALASLFRLANARSALLLAKSIALAASVAGAATLLSIAAVHWAQEKQGHAKPWITWLPLALVLVPPYVHATAWLRFAQMMNGALQTAGFAPLPLTGWFGAFWVQLMALLPIALAFAHVGFAMCDRARLDAARVFADDWRVFWHVERPQAFPATAVGAALIFILSATDYSIPTLMQQPVYALEAFVEYSIAADSTAAFVVALPLLAVCALVMAVAVMPVKRLTVGMSFTPQTGRAFPSTLPLPLRVLSGLAVIVCLMQFAVPCAALLFSAVSLGNPLPVWARSTAEISNSVLVAGVAAALSVGLALLITPRLTSPARLALIIIPLAIPGSLAGIGLLKMWSTPGINALYGTAALPILAMIARFSTLAILMMYVQSKRIDPLLLDAARVFRGDGLAVWLMVRLPLYLPGMLAAFFVVFGLALSELNASVLVALPGKQALSAKIFGLLHYGASKEVAALCLLTMLGSILSILAGYWAGQLWWPRKGAAS